MTMIFLALVTGNANTFPKSLYTEIFLSRKPATSPGYEAF